MAKSAQGGFTIIEVVLFLAITGGLFAALMIGVNSGVTQQRYLDSVRSFSSLLQNQYSQVVNTPNASTTNGACAPDGSIDNSVTRGDRGASQCVLLGRAVRVTYDGGAQTIATSSITGYDPTGTDQDSDGDRIFDSKQITTSDDVTVLTKYYHAQLARFDTESSSLDWGSQLTTASTSAASRKPSNALILIMKSPASGAIRVFAIDDMRTRVLDSGTNDDLTPFVTASTSTSIMKNCVDGDSGSLPHQLLSLNPLVSGPDAVAVTDDGGNECN